MLNTLITQETCGIAGLDLQIRTSSGRDLRFEFFVRPIFEYDTKKFGRRGGPRTRRKRKQGMKMRADVARIEHFRISGM